MAELPAVINQTNQTLLELLEIGDCFIKVSNLLQKPFKDFNDETKEKLQANNHALEAELKIIEQSCNSEGTTLEERKIFQTQFAKTTNQIIANNNRQIRLSFADKIVQILSYTATGFVIYKIFKQVAKNI